jgi:hypothetical protein
MSPWISSTGPQRHVGGSCKNYCVACFENSTLYRRADSRARQLVLEGEPDLVQISCRLGSLNGDKLSARLSGEPPGFTTAYSFCVVCAHTGATEHEVYSARPSRSE